MYLLNFFIERRVVRVVSAVETVDKRAGLQRRAAAYVESCVDGSGMLEGVKAWFDRCSWVIHRLSGMFHIVLNEEF